VTSIGEGAFSECSRVTSITVASGNLIYRSEGICLIRISDNKLISGFKNSIIPDSVMSIGDYAFYFCYDLTSITIPNSVTSIGKGAFNGCRDLRSITIPSSVTSLGEGAFLCNLRSVTFQGTIDSANFHSYVFSMDLSYLGITMDGLREKFYATDTAHGTPGTYTRANGDTNTWTKQP